MNIPHITEHKAIALFNQKFGTDKITRFLKVREEFREMTEAFSEYLATGNDEHLRDEICDLKATLTHFASLFNLFQKEMLETSMDKVVTRETKPGYKRYKRIGIIAAYKPISINDPVEELLRKHYHAPIIPEGAFNVVVLDTGTPNDKFLLRPKLDIMEIELLSEPNPIKHEYDKVKETKPWDRKELNRNSKPSYKKKRR